MQLESDIKILHMELIKYYVESADSQEKDLSVLTALIQSKLNIKWQALSEKYTTFGIKFGKTPNLLKQVREREKTLIIVAVLLLLYLIYPRYEAFVDGQQVSYTDIFISLIMFTTVLVSVIYYFYYYPAYKKVLSLISGTMLNANLLTRTSIGISSIANRKKIIFLMAIIFLYIFLEDPVDTNSRQVSKSIESTKVSK